MSQRCLLASQGPWAGGEVGWRQQGPFWPGWVCTQTPTLLADPVVWLESGMKSFESQEEGAQVQTLVCWAQGHSSARISSRGFYWRLGSPWFEAPLLLLQLPLPGAISTRGLVRPGEEGASPVF